MSLDFIPIATAQRLVVLRQVPGQDRVLTPAALGFLTELQARFGHKLHALMVARDRRQERFDRGEMPDYLAETTDTRKGIWSAAPMPPVLLDRRAEIVGPLARDAMQTALGSGARVFVADQEDRTSHSFTAVIAGHANLLDHRDGPLDQVGPEPALLILRPRALHGTEANVMIGGHGMSAALFDFGLDIFHNGRALAATGRGPFYELAKLESHREARFWNEVFLFAEDRVGLAHGTIKATVCIESLNAAYEMDEIVWELRDHIAAMSLNRANYTVSFIRAMRRHADRTLPGDTPHDRAFLATCAARLVKVCHRRGILAIGEGEPEHEVRIGFDGSRGDPAETMAVFAEEMIGPNQMRVPRQGWRIEPEMLIQPHKGEATQAMLEAEIRTAIAEVAAWLSGRPARMDLADLARMRIWQWRQHGAEVDGMRLTSDRLAEAIQAEVVELLATHGAHGFHRGHFAPAARLFHEAVMGAAPEPAAIPAYPVLNAVD
ncbi:malate synthase A [Cereibacter sp. SYSU M97828]|nr:malate synthase A [Cereibacter flavus]